MVPGRPRQAQVGGAWECRASFWSVGLRSLAVTFTAYVLTVWGGRNGKEERSASWVCGSACSFLRHGLVVPGCQGALPTPHPAPSSFLYSVVNPEGL